MYPVSSTSYCGSSTLFPITRLKRSHSTSSLSVSPSFTAVPNSGRKYSATLQPCSVPSNPAEISAVRSVMATLQPILEKILEDFGKMPESVDEQHQFIEQYLPKLQDWVNGHFEDLCGLQGKLNLPNPLDRYGRNLILSIPDKKIYVFLHRLNPGMATPKHWHSEKGLPALAFATSLSQGAVETKWQERGTDDAIVCFENAQETSCTPKKLVAIPGDYGAHQIANTTEKPIALFEIYFEPEPLNNLDLPVSVINSPEQHIMDTVPCSWLPDRNMLSTAIRLNWPISHLLQDRVKLADPKFSFFKVIDRETFFVPQSQLHHFITDTSKLLEGPNERFLLI